MSGINLPITGVCVVSDPSNCPPNYILIDKTYDKPEDADLWKDGFFAKRVMRYLCVERQMPSQNQDVLVDVALINERDPPPAGFTPLEFTHDTNDKSTKKKHICVRWMVPSMTQDAITELILCTRTQRRAPMGFTLVGEVNNMALCYKMSKVPQLKDSAGGEETQNTPVPGAALPYAIAPGGPPPVPARPNGAPPTLVRHSSVTRGGPDASSSSLSTGGVNPLSGVQWKMNPKYKHLMSLQDVTIPTIRGKTLGDIEREYAYDFSVERSVSKTTLS